MKSNFDVVIVGGGHAGSHLVNTLNRKKYSGTVAFINAESALPYHRPPLSKECLTAEVLKPRPLLSGGAFSNEKFEHKQGVKVVSGNIDDKLLALSDGSQVQYDKLVLATGSALRALNVPGETLEGVFTLKTLEDAKNMRDNLSSAKNIVLVGGGFINLELACSLASADRHITILEKNERLLQRAVSPDISSYLYAQAINQGVKVHFSAGVTQIEGESNRVDHVITDTGDKLAADFVVIAIGSEADTSLALDLGLTCKNGLVVDSHLMSQAGIYGIGDCVSFPNTSANTMMRLESVQNATDQANFVASALLLEEQQAYYALPWFWSIQGQNRLQMAGLWSQSMSAVSAKSDHDSSFSIYHYDGEVLKAVESINSPGEHLHARQMLNAGFSPKPSDVMQGFEAVKQAFLQESKK